MSEQVSGIYIGAFGLGPVFTSTIRLLHHDIPSLLKMNEKLCAPFPAYRNIQQACPLSGMLYALTTEMLTHELQQHLMSLAPLSTAAPAAGPQLRKQHMLMT